MRRYSTGVALIGWSLMMVLTACINLDADITLNSKAQATGAYTLDISKQAASFLGVTSAQSLEDMIFENEDMSVPRGSSVDVKETDTSYVMTVKLQDTELTDDGMKAEVLSDGRVKFTFKNEGLSGEEFDMGLGVGNLTVKVGFPGKVEEVVGFTKVDAKTVSLKATLSDSVDAYAISETGGTNGQNSLIIFAAIVAVIAVLGFVASKRKKEGGVL